MDAAKLIAPGAAELMQRGRQADLWMTGISLAAPYAISLAGPLTHRLGGESSPTSMRSSPAWTT